MPVSYPQGMVLDANQTVTVAAGVTSDTVIKAGSGWLAKIVVTTTAGAAATLIYDNATAGSGTPIAALPASAAIGVYAVGMPAGNGITVKGAATNPALTISFY